MQGVRHRFDMGPFLRSLGLLLLLSVVIFQGMAHSGAAMTPLTDAGHADHATVDCPMQGMTMQPMKMDDPAPAAPHHDDGHDRAAKCMPSMCCFHDPSPTMNLSATGVLLSTVRVIERGVNPPSHLGSTKDRPPRHI